MLDQIHLPDPIRYEICKLVIRLEALEAKEGSLTQEELELREKARCALCPDNPYIDEENGGVENEIV
jgi:hypothetical protein